MEGNQFYLIFKTASIKFYMKKRIYWNAKYLYLGILENDHVYINIISLTLWNQKTFLILNDVGPKVIILQLRVCVCVCVCALTIVATVMQL